MEGKINFFACEDTSGKRPHFKGYVEISGEVHEFAVWPAKSGKGYSGRYKPKQVKPETQAQLDTMRETVKPPLIDDEIPF